MDIVTIGLLGIASSIVAELITYVNKKLTGTLLQGNGAFLVILAIALIGAFVKIAFTQGITVLSIQDVAQQFAYIFTVSQAYFVLIATKLGITVKQ